MAYTATDPKTIPPAVFQKQAEGNKKIKKVIQIYVLSVNISGNSAADACLSSPANVAETIIVGATDITRGYGGDSGYGNGPAFTFNGVRQSKRKPRDNTLDSLSVGC